MSAPAATPAGKTLLVVEDNDIQREGLALALRREGYAIRLAANGQEALDSLREPPLPDLILLDMLLPVLDGWHFLEELKRSLPRPPRIVICTANTVIGRDWAETHGCAGLVRKPIESGALLDEIRRCL